MLLHVSVLEDRAEQKQVGVGFSHRKAETNLLETVALQSDHNEVWVTVDS